VNLLSITGYYGKQIQKVAEKLLADKMITFIGTDLHHHKHMQVIQSIGRDKKLMKLLDQYGFRNRELTNG
jgi:protein-tyrosine phosphatase